MRARTITLVKTFALLTLLAFPQSPSRAAAPKGATADALAALRAAAPAVSWNKSISASGHFSCRKTLDSVVVGHVGKTVWIGMAEAPSRPGAMPRTTTQQWVIDRNRQDAFCAMPTGVTVSPHDCQTGDGPISGCKKIAGRQDFSVNDDECDSVHFYWNSKQRAFSAWRS